MNDLQKKIKECFPLLRTNVHNRALVYFDNAATTQKPETVLNAINGYYSKINSNVHRGIHYLSQLATEAYESARKEVQEFINAEYSHEIIFTKGSTESINLVASCFDKAFLRENDEIIISVMEHHSNIVPWQIVGPDKNIKQRVIQINEKGELCLDEYESMFNEHTKLLAISQASNVLGTINPIKKMIEIAHSHNVAVLVDGAQGIKCCITDVKDLDCDFYCFSGHKIYAPMGIGVLYGKEKYLEKMPPYQGGGNMIQHVSFEKTIFNELPFKFEAGTPNVEGAIGLQAALKFVKNFGRQQLIDMETSILKYASDKLTQIDGIKIYGTSENKASIISFLLDGQHPTDIGTLLDFMGIAVRTGHHCCQPLMDYLHIPGTIRASFAAYNTEEEIDSFINALIRAKKMLQ